MTNPTPRAAEHAHELAAHVPAAWLHGDPDAVIRTILAEPVYRNPKALAPHASVGDSIQAWLGDWLKHAIDALFQRLFPQGLSGEATSRIAVVVGYTVVASAALALIALVLWIVLSFTRRERARAEGDDGLALDERERVRRLDWRRAERAAQRGAFAQAVEAIFAASLRLLDERAIVPFDAARAPGEYRRLVRQRRRAATEAFETVTNRFVRAAYAAQPTSREAYDERGASLSDPRAPAGARMTRPRVAEIAFAVLGALLLATLTMLTPSRTPPPPEPYSSYETAARGYRAWYELLEREGLPVRRFERRAVFLDRSIATLIVGNPSSNDGVSDKKTPEDRSRGPQGVGARRRDARRPGHGGDGRRVRRSGHADERGLARREDSARRFRASYRTPASWRGSPDARARP